MSNEIIKRDANFRTVGAAVTNDIDTDIYMLLVDPTTLELECDVTDDTVAPDSNYKIAQRDQNFRTTCLAYNEITCDVEEILTDNDGYLLAQLT